MELSKSLNKIKLDNDSDANILANKMVSKGPYTQCKASKQKIFGGIIKRFALWL